MKRTVGYDGQGNASVFTSYDASNTVVNQVVREFNGFGQVTREYQAAAGAVNTSTTPFVQYDYSEADTGNHSRLTKITYPDGYELVYNYATGADDNISRLTSISDSTGTLESYAYQGEGTVLERNHAQPGLDLTTTLDDFGRISDFNWTNSGGSVSHYAYGYDAAGNRLYKEDLVNSGLSELYGYDNLYQLTSFARGTLNSTKDAITGTPDMEQSWNHDALGNWNSVTTDGTTETRAANAQNEYTNVGGNTPTYDSNGNMTTDQTGKHFVWDAWNRLVEVKDASSVTLKTYTYDALNRRVTDSDGTTTKNLYYSTSWQVVLESEGEPTSTTTGMTRYVWSPVYVDAMIRRDRDADNNETLEERLWAVQDANFNMVALVDNSGNVVERYKYTPFGVATVLDASGTVISGSAYGWVHLHQMLLLEEASGLYDNRFRWYSATLGQFVSNDPLGFAAGDVNLVRRYVGNGPVSGLDPSGEDKLFGHEFVSPFSGRADFSIRRNLENIGGAIVTAAAGTFSGAGAGAVTGGATGLVVGSVAPGPGTLVGGGVGAVIGTGLGGVTGFFNSMFADDPVDAMVQGTKKGGVAGVGAVPVGRAVLSFERLWGMCEKWAAPAAPMPVPQTLKEVDLPGRIRDAGHTDLKRVGEFFGWAPRQVTKTAADFTKDQLLANGWTKERLLNVAEGYEHIARITPANPSAAGRATQLRDLAKLFD